MDSALHAHKIFDLRIKHKNTIDESTKRKVVENLSTIFPRISVPIFFSDLVIKSIYCGDLSKLVKFSTLIHDFLAKE